MGRQIKTHIRLMIINILILSPSVYAVASQALLGCDDRCGDLQIPYPFGTREGCYLNKNFLITCNTTHFDPPRPFLRTGNIQVTNISISGELQILHFGAKDCYPKNNSLDARRTSATLNLSTFTVSSTKNKFTVIGCDTYAFLSGQIEGQSYRTACVALCDNITTVRDGACSGNGCCQLDIPSGLKGLRYRVRSFDNHTDVFSFNPCGYAFVTEEDKFHFSAAYIRNFPQRQVPVVLDWGISNTTCSTANNKSNCICGPNSMMVNVLPDGSEYRCGCLDGFEGNPYLPRGCQDIDECRDERLNDCKFECVNTKGNYTCNCPEGFKGDGRRGGEGCTRSSKSFVQVIIGVSVGFTVLVIGSTWLYLGYRKWKLIKLKEKFFEENGGLMLQRHLSQWKSSTDTVTIFTQEELDKATNKYDESAVIGKGGYGTVYKGILPDGSVVAIKKSKLVDQSQTSQFINEVIVLSQINHRNVVKLLGCCLETQVPLLVYEFVTNGTLFDHIHDTTKHVPLSWKARLRIALETAGVISYLHSSASTPIIHRDIKTTNILLDDNYNAKVSDFGASKLVPLDQTQLSTMVQGTLGYLDPEYLLTSELTEKSDVYSFGIVLLELITGKKAVSFEGPEAERNLAMYVLCAMKEDRLGEVVEKGMAREGEFEQIKDVGKVARKCLRISGEERPSMKEVVMELEGLRVMAEHEWVDEENLVADGASNIFVVSGSTNVVDDSMKVQVLPLIHDGR
ncbi:wall-associated receptor kinase 2-like [Cucurbita maxima]|uniref:Wall-associated receptor kinase 2-like n=1 Tax=Cucurbita maxima TaxID=3661 RepID=A0A6J1JNA5_CUCMA|nr:wall-associated receptor kinase 2-like [Cucurbita maxima]